MVLRDKMTLLYPASIQLLGPFWRDHMQRVFSLKWTSSAHTFQEFGRNQIRERIFQEISASTDASYNSKKKKKKEREDCKIVYFNNTSYIFVLNWWLGITIEQSLVVSCPVVLSLSFFFLISNLHVSVSLYNVHNVNCNILNVWQDIHAHDITCWEDREATIGLASGRGRISAAIEMSPQKSVWQPAVQPKGDWTRIVGGTLAHAAYGLNSSSWGIYIILPHAESQSSGFVAPGQREGVEMEELVTAPCPIVEMKNVDTIRL